MFGSIGFSMLLCPIFAVLVNLVFTSALMPQFSLTKITGEADW